MNKRTARRWSWLAGAAVLMAAAAGHASTTSQSAGPLDQGPDNQGEGLSVKVVLHCRVKADATVDQCTVASENPTGHNLGEAAVRMSSQIRIDQATFSPEMVGQMIDIPIRFAPDAPPDGDMPSGVAQTPM